MGLNNSLINWNQFIYVLMYVVVIIQTSNCEADTKTPGTVKCDPPPVPTNGQHDFVPEKSRIHSFVSFSCNEGYELKGEQVVECGESGTWIPEIPICKKIVSCGYPGNGIHSKTNISEYFSSAGTTAAYECEQGYVLKGPSTRTCNEQGSWYPEQIPICMVNVAEKRPVFNVSSHIDRDNGMYYIKGRGIIVDGSPNSCSIATESSVKDSFWTIDLQQIQNVDILTLTFRDISDIDFLIYYGIQKHELRKIEDHEFTLESVDNGKKTAAEVTFKEPKELRYLSIVVLPTKEVTLEFCEVMVLSKSAISNKMCNSKAYDKTFDVSRVITELNNGTCYTFAISVEDTWVNSNRRCLMKFNGTLVSNLNEEKNKLLQKHLVDIYPGNAKQKSYWIGGYRPKGYDSDRKWYWIQNNKTIEDFFWAYNQPNSLDSNCINMAGVENWDWNDSPCDIRTHFICEHQIMQCGLPDQKEYSLIKQLIQSTDVGTKIKYECPLRFKLEGSAERQCEKTGQWSGVAPKCIPTVKEHKPSTPQEQSGGLKAGAIVGIVLGIIAAVIIIIVIIIFIFKKKKFGSKPVRYNKESESTEALDVDNAERNNYSSTSQGK